ncbi:MAG: aminotransferase class I/II-fold pyridoxal phosphate-dependent enzyme [Vicinamibacterales bacterium]|nr:aminotransferase class I/II-fold pyridoxal phosphate-dependent enzyme [Vicinamibacterales bacterium]MDP7479198.1 aminotransferase class I/II-fold pyridoxal phosphate-dependent enzyme [Vicinamibacterales bacterium]MDP7691051.1 aminotransferase class I/II-fold pyridoxal phosphate-dependent enzyme [Vicinamibacterales bacterium]HJN46957.1 aminotransferase class I/II-fold pyridoxal phosphate-dependent enzyme [Vicinamibacterales bacterium]
MDISESVIRRMTRLAVEHDAVNLSQGFTDEPPVFDLVWAAVSAMLGGNDEQSDRLCASTLRELVPGADPDELLDRPLKTVLARLQGRRDRLNQYSFPFGLTELREAIADYTERLYLWRPDPATEVTVTLGATEALASVLGAVCRAGDRVIVPQPYHEMYPSQAAIFGLEPDYVTLVEQLDGGGWELDRDEWVAAAARGARALILNTPHNPTGKVFSADDLTFVAELAARHDLLIIVDEIYEHIVFDGHRHQSLAALPGMRARTIVVNSISKTGNATGWRVGWVIAPAVLSPPIRGFHDTMVIQAPTPLQRATVTLLGLDQDVYDRLRAAYVRKRDTLMAALRKAGFGVSPPEGAYYLFARYRGVPAIGAQSPMAAALHLIKEIGVASVPGDNFYTTGAAGDQYLRFAFCRSLPTLEEAAKRLAML